MRIDVLTLFPRMFDGVLRESIIKRAVDKKMVRITVHNLRDWSKDRHRKVDDKPYGGGPGMLISCQPIFDAVKKLKSKYPLTPSPSLRSGSGQALTLSPEGRGNSREKPSTHRGDRNTTSPSPRRGEGRGEGKKTRVILLSPQGKRFDQKLANRLARQRHLILICGHYEGVDERVKKIITDELSIGGYVLTGGEIPAMAIIDALVRLIPGVLGNKDSARLDSFQGRFLDYPQYTRPRVYRGLKVPEILLTGNHKKIEEWRWNHMTKIQMAKKPLTLALSPKGRGNSREKPSTHRGDRNTTSPSPRRGEGRACPERSEGGEGEREG